MLYFQHKGPKRESVYRDSDHGVWPGAKTAVHDPPPPAAVPRCRAPPGDGRHTAGTDT